MVDRDDDLKIGIRTSAITLGRFDVIGVAAFYALCLGCWAWVGQMLGLGGAYQLGLVVAAMQASYHVWLIRRRQREQCFQAFRLNHWLGMSVWLGAAVDTAWPTLLG
jgi:4-hydroxybenzoate polyprenyltransferase